MSNKIGLKPCSLDPALPFCIYCWPCKCHFTFLYCILESCWESRFWKFSSQEKNLVTVPWWMWSKMIVVTILQYIHVSNCYVVYPWTEEPGGLHSPWGLKELDMIEWLSAHTHTPLMQCYMSTISKLQNEIKYQVNLGEKRKEKESGVPVAGLLPEMTWERTEMCNANFN